MLPVARRQARSSVHVWGWRWVLVHYTRGRRLCVARARRAVRKGYVL